MLLYQTWSICLRNVPCPAPLLKTWPPSSWRLLCKLGTPPSENICFPHRQDRHRPHVSAGSHSSEREPFPCPHALTPTFITPLPPLPRPPQALGLGLDLSITSPSPPSTCSTVPVWSLYCWEDCSCLVIPTSRPVERKGGRGGMEGEGEEASVLLPQSGDCWSADRSICHPLPSHSHLLSEGLTLPTVLLCSLPLPLLAPASLWLCEALGSLL